MERVDIPQEVVMWENKLFLVYPNGSEGFEPYNKFIVRAFTSKVEHGIQVQFKLYDKGTQIKLIDLTFDEFCEYKSFGGEVEFVKL